MSLKQTPSIRSVQSDTRGAIMMIAVFMAMIAIGALYYMAGLGDAILAQERMQDAADAAAFSSAVIHARGMNVLALINIMMASLLAILVLLSMLSSLFTAAVVILAAVSWFIPGAAALIPAANTASKGFGEAERAARGPVHTTIKAMHKLQGPLNTAIPMLASVNAAKLSRNNYGKVVEFGVTFPIMDGLPTREGSFKILCDKAGNYAGQMVVAPIKAAIGDNFLTNKLSKGASSLGEKYAAFYCGDGPKPKAKIFTEKVSIPELETSASRQCQESKDEAACNTYQKQIDDLRSAYDGDAGVCTEGQSNSASAKELCDDIRILARTQCNPKSKKPKIRESTWEERRYTRRWILVGEDDSAHLEEVPRKQDDYHYAIRGDDPKHIAQTSPGVSTAGTPGFTALLNGKVPCGPSFLYEGESMSEWKSSAGAGEPVCASKVEVPTLAMFKAVKIKEYEIKVLEVVDVLRCVIERDIESELNGEPLSAEDKEGMAPQEMCSCAALGEESFQVRSIVLGSPDKYTQNADKTILVATQGRSPTTSKLASLGKYAGKVSAAQAEYYYNDAGADRSEWLWNMKWRARMRRLAFNRTPYECKVADTCKTGQGRLVKTDTGDQADAINAFRTLLGNVDNIIVH